MGFLWDEAFCYEGDFSLCLWLKIEEANRRIKFPDLYLLKHCTKKRIWKRGTFPKGEISVPPSKKFFCIFVCYFHAVIEI